MENVDASPPFDSNTATTFSTSLPSLAPQMLPQTPSISVESKSSSFSSNFIYMYHSLFPPKLSPSLTPSSCSPSSSSTDHHHHHELSTDHHHHHELSTEHRLNQARLILEYHQLSDHYDLCISRLRDLADELDSIRRENSELRLANTELLKRLSLSSHTTLHNFSFRNDFHHLSLGGLDPDRRVSEEVSGSGLSPTSVMEHNRFEKPDSEPVSFPKIISIRSSGYLKANQAGASNGGPSLSRSTRSRVSSQLASASQRVCVSGRKREEEAVEFDVYNQGMLKTELCNKWQESGKCPYGDHCQFAHGVKELRPVIRHPRYKTEVCRMVLAGDTCPYGHRCHFRHSLTEQERAVGPRDGRS